MKLKRIFPLLLISINKIDEPSLKLECPYCQEKDLKKFVKVGEGNIKCMSCCHYIE